MKTTGKAAIKIIDLLCPECEYQEERTIDMREIDGEEEERQAMIIQCPNCEHPEMQRVWLKAPSGRIGGAKSERSIESMQHSFKERFVKGEINDVRHRFGKLFDQNLVSSAVKRIKDGEA
jgi:hypothetical protein